MSDFETSPPKEIEIDADGEGGEALLKKSPSPEQDAAKTNGKLADDANRSFSKSKSRSRSRSRSHQRHNRSRRRYSRSRSRSPRYYKRKRSRNSRSRSGGHRDYDYDKYDRDDKYQSSYHRGHSRSPMSSRKRHHGDRENPEPNRCIGVFGLSLYTQERGLRDVFGRYGPIDEVQVVYDRQTGRSRGFAFVYYKSSDDAFEAKERCNGIDIDGRRIRVDFSITERAHTPTPGIYLGRSYDSSYRSPPGRRYSSYRRSPSPYGYSYRRSDSYSPPR